MNTPSKVIENSYKSGHFVVVTENVNLQYPPTLWDNRNYHSDEVLEKAQEAAAHQVGRKSILGRNLGFGVFNRNGMASYMYTVYAMVEGVDHTYRNGDERLFSRALEIGHAHDIKDVEELVRQFHARYEGKSEDELAEALDAELARHDWYAAMSDSWSTTQAGQRHMDEVIRPLLAHLPEERGSAVWQKHAPKDFTNPYATT